MERELRDRQGVGVGRRYPPHLRRSTGNARATGVRLQPHLGVVLGVSFYHDRAFVSRERPGVPDGSRVDGRWRAKKDAVTRWFAMAPCMRYRTATPIQFAFSKTTSLTPSNRSRSQSHYVPPHCYRHIPTDCFHTKPAPPPPPTATTTHH